VPFARPCLKCGVLIRGGSYCTPHNPRARDTGARKEKKRNLYGGDYWKRAKLVRETATHCHLCGKQFVEGDRVEADHLIAGDPNSPLAPAHRECNNKRGNTPLL